jgi:uncharacterized protein
MSSLYSTHRPFRILSLDGGGLKGLFTAAFLAEVEVQTGKQIVDHFDLIAGTSTGGIMAIGLGLGRTAEDIRQFYIENGARIFPAQTCLSRLFVSARRLIRRGYDAKPLESALQGCLGRDRLLGESRTRLVIPAFDGHNCDVYLFKTAHHSRLQVDYKRAAWEVARSTAAAPTYFESYLMDGYAQLVDGGMWANNPCVVALTDAVSLLGIPLEAVSMLSIGTGFEPLSARRSHRRGGMLQWGSAALEFLMRGQSQAATHQAGLLLGKKSFFRIDPVVPRGRYSLDKMWAELCGLGQIEARKALPLVESTFLTTPKPDFEPHHSLQEYTS